MNRLASPLALTLGALFVATACGGDMELPPEPIASEEEALLVPPPPTPRGARDNYLRQRLDALLANDIEGRSPGHVPALGAALVIDGEIVASATRGVRTWGQPGAARIDDYFNTGSVTKVATGYVAAVFIQYGAAIDATHTFGWDTRILDVFPELDDLIQPEFEELTVADLLAHNTRMPGAPTTEPADQYASIAPDITDRRYEYVKDAIADTPLDTDVYGGGSIIVAAMLERITGTTWENLVDTFLSEPLGMANMGVGQTPWPPSTQATTLHDWVGVTPTPWTPFDHYDETCNAPAGNLHGSVEDMAILAAAFMPGASHNPGYLAPAILAETLAFVPSDLSSDYTRAGWGWRNGAFWKNGSAGKSYAEITMSPTGNHATAMAANANVGNSAGGWVTKEVNALRTHFDIAGSYKSTIKSLGATVWEEGTLLHPDAAVDANFTSSWRAFSAQAKLGIEFPPGTSLTQIRVGEKGNDVTQFKLEALTSSGYVTLLTGTSLGPNFSASFPAITTTRLRLSVTTPATLRPTLDEVWAF